MPLGLGMGLGITASRAAKAAALAFNVPLLNAEVQGRLGNTRINNASFRHRVERWPHVLGFETDEIVLCWNNAFEGTDFFTNTGNQIDFIGVSFRHPNGTIIPVTFSGARTATLPNGTYDFLSDPIKFSALGLPTAKRGEFIWEKQNYSVPSNGNYISCHSQIFNSDESGSQGAWYNPAATTISNTDIDGAYTVTGTPLTGTSNGMRPIILAKPVGAAESFIACGDSIGQSQNDEGNGAYGRGFIQRGVANRGKNVYPCLNLCREGAKIDLFLDSSSWRSLIKYTTIAISQGGTNNMTPDSVATIIGKEEQLWDVLRNGGVKKIFRTGLMNSADSTDSWLTVANQTPRTNWGPGEKRDQFNAAMEQAALDGDIEKYIPMDALSDPSAPNKWRADNTAAQLTAYDATHPSPAGHAIAGEVLRLAILKAFNIPITPDQFLGLTVVRNAAVASTLLDANNVAYGQPGFLNKIAKWTGLFSTGDATQSTDALRLTMGGKSINGIVIPEGNGTSQYLVEPAGSIQAGPQTWLGTFYPDTTDQADRSIGNTGSNGAKTNFSFGNQSVNFANVQLSKAVPVSATPIMQVCRTNSGNGPSTQRLKVNTDAEIQGAIDRVYSVSGIALGAYGNGGAGWMDGGVGVLIGYNQQYYAPVINALVNEYIDPDFNVSSHWSDLYF